MVKPMSCVQRHCQPCLGKIYTVPMRRGWDLAKVVVHHHQLNDPGNHEIRPLIIQLWRKECAFKLRYESLRSIIVGLFTCFSNLGTHSWALKGPKHKNRELNPCLYSVMSQLAWLAINFATPLQYQHSAGEHSSLARNNNNCTWKIFLHQPCDGQQRVQEQ